MGAGSYIETGDARFDVVSGIAVKDGFPTPMVKLTMQEAEEEGRELPAPAEALVDFDALTASKVGAMLIAAAEAARGDVALYEKLMGEGMPQETIGQVLEEVGARRNRRLERELQE